MSTQEATGTTLGKRSRISRGGKQPSTTRPKPKGWKRNGDIEGTDTKQQNEEEEGDDSEQCIICANKIQYAAISPCNHTTCHVCAFRQRSLYERNACLVCRTENESLIFSEQIDKNFAEFQEKHFTDVDEKLKIKFTAQYVYRDTIGLLENNCSICHSTFSNFKELNEHIKSEHNKYYCVICSKNKKAFISELGTFTYKQLQKHLSEGNGKDFKGHPECKHCRGKRFYSEDELNVHIRDRHERCHICDQNDPKNADYFRNYDNLYSHFKSDHYVCSVPSCIEKRFVVFREDLDLTAHMLREHGGLTGSNGKVVIGSSSRQFHSQLSTFSSSNSSSTSSSNDRRGGQVHSSDQVDSYDVKKMRLEERAKHYLNYNNREIKKFLDLNINFRSKQLSAKDLLKSYKELFKNSKDADINILLFEFSELFQENSDQYKDLITTSAEYEGGIQQREQYPVLGNSSNGGLSMNSWGSNSNSRQTGSSIERFPTLEKPKKPKTLAINANKPIKYTTVIKKLLSSSYSPVNINNSRASPTYKPDYLSNLNKAPPLSSLPTLGGSSRSNSASSSGSNTPSRASATNSGASTPNLPESKFPALEKKPAKRTFPRVNPVNTGPGVWGSNEESKKDTKENSVDEDWGVPIIDKRQQKLKKKQNKLIFKS